MKEPDLEEEALRAGGAAGPHDRAADEGDTVAPVTVIGLPARAKTVTLAAAGPGLWRATVPADEIGLWRAEEGDKRAFAHVGADQSAGIR